MPGRRPKPARPVSGVQAIEVDDPATQRALDGLVDAVQAVQAQRSRDVVTADLVVGTNKVVHGLGRACAGYTLTPTVADATFAHAIDKSNPNPERELWVTVVGSEQPGAILEVY